MWSGFLFWVVLESKRKRQRQGRPSRCRYDVSLIQWLFAPPTPCRESAFANFGQLNA